MIHIFVINFHSNYGNLLDVGIFLSLTAGTSHKTADIRSDRLTARWPVVNTAVAGGRPMIVFIRVFTELFFPVAVKADTSLPVRQVLVRCARP